MARLLSMHLMRVRELSSHRLPPALLWALDAPARDVLIAQGRAFHLPRLWMTAGVTVRAGGAMAASVGLRGGDGRAADLVR